MIIFAEDHYVAIKDNKVVGIVERSTEHGKWAWIPFDGSGLNYLKLSYALELARRACE